jgi:hypothetical protein
MPLYKLYHLDGNGQIARAPDEFDVESDQAAMAEAERRRAGAPAELWQAQRLVRRVR